MFREQQPKGTFKTLPFPTNAIAKPLDFGGNSNVNNTICVGSTQTRDGLSSSSAGYCPSQTVIPPIPTTPRENTENVNLTPSQSTTRKRSNSDPRIKRKEIPNSVDNTILQYQSQTSEEDTLTVRERFDRDDKLPHSPNSLFEFRSEKQRVEYEREREQKRVEEENNKKKDEQFTVPRKFSSNFHRMIREKAVQTLTTTRNTFQVLTDESDSENDDEIGKIVKKRKKGAKFVPFHIKETTAAPPKQPVASTSNANNTNSNPSNKNTNKNIKNKTTMPPIVIDGKTANPNQLISDLKALVQGEFSVKHTNRTTILFVEGKEDYEKVLNNVKSEKMAYHTYTAYSEKSHAFVLRGLAENTKIQDIKENLEDDHEIVAREIYIMKTKERPLYLSVVFRLIAERVSVLQVFSKQADICISTRAFPSTNVKVNTEENVLI
ncbi:unnamed protein product [Psylliodes chrysocephalus]|uniref:Uncharacterized protein n=1 Tax=Psylliodes chrysocephalus TaxID=3402493 RepID=A0A9P0G9L4_9CUCU|nr:unnamed protein product [Psylliodes chrysocephala]